MEPTTQDQNLAPSSSDKEEFIPFTDAQLATLAGRRNKYFADAQQKIAYDVELASALDDRVQEAIRRGKTVSVSPEMTGFACR
jgi:hypothetical protein